MRTQDGQPRGFGYVTLDSPEAAQKCLAEPQEIDGRIVDMKLAVPEGAQPGAARMKGSYGSSFLGHGGFGMDMYGRDYSDWSGTYDNAYLWSGEQSLGGGHYMDCMELLCSSRGMSAAPGLQIHNDYAEGYDYGDATACIDSGLLLPPFLSSEPQPRQSVPTDFQQLLENNLKMSANAAEFIPRGAQQSKNAAVKKTVRAKAPLGDLTNVNAQPGDLLKPFASPAKANPDIKAGFLNTPGSPSEAASPSQKKLGKPLFLDVDDDEQLTHSPSENNGISDSSQIMSSPATTVEPGSAEASRAAIETTPEEKAVDSENEESSVGSENEQEDDDTEQVDLGEPPSVGSALHASGECKRCNFFAKGRCQNGKDCSFCHYPHEKRKHSRQEKRERKAAWLDSNLNELDAVQTVLGMKSPTGALSPSAAAWQPEAESAALSMLSHTWSMEQSPFQMMTSAPVSAAFLSTVPSTAPSAATTPYPTPLPTPSGALGAGMMFPSSWGAWNEVDVPESSGPKFSRTDLLSLREHMLKKGEVTEEGSLKIRTQKLAA